MEDKFFKDMGDKKMLSSRAMYRDIEYLANCKKACTADVDCKAIGYDMASTVCVLYGDERKLRPPMWEILHGVDGYPPLNGMIYLKVEDAVGRIPDNSLAVFIIGPPGITIVLTVLGILYGIRRWFQLRAKRKRREKRRFDRMLTSNSRKIEKLQTARTEKRAENEHGRLYRFGYGISWDAWWKTKSAAIAKEERADHEEFVGDDDDEFLQKLERDEHESNHGEAEGEDEPGNVDDEGEPDDPDLAPEPDAPGLEEKAPEQQRVASGY